MALSFTIGSAVVLDETAGLQNSTASAGVLGDSDDNDIILSSSSFPSVFTVLSAFGSVTKTALSGYTGAAGNTGSDAFTVSPGTGAAITDVSFVGPDGQPLAGLDSGLLTLDGKKIFLYTGTNNNVLLGRVGLDDDTPNPNGVVAFAGYIQETLTNGAITGGKVWLSEYQPLLNPDPANPDDPVNLAGKVFVGASQDANFSLAGAPSGQQLFLMFSTEGATPDVNGRIPGVSIVVTGKDPLDQSASGAAITSADTVNSSQGGGDTTLGTNNQAVTEQEGLRFSFVTGARADVTIPNLEPGEAGVESNIDFTQYFGARSATFQIVQETGGTTAMVRLTAFRNVDNDAEGSQSGVNFINSYADDATEKVAINIASISVTTFAGAAVTGVVVLDNGDGSVTITGVPTDSQITYVTASDHNRVMIENAGSLTAKNSDKTHADFDIGGFKVLQTSVDKIEIGSNMVFEDDGPSVAVTVTASADALAVDETTLGTNASANYADNFGNTPNFGADGAATVNSITSVFALEVSAAGVDSGLDDVATGANVLLYLENGQVVGRAGSDSGAIVFVVSVSAAGLVSLDQQRALVHSNVTDPDDAVSPVGTNLITLRRTDTIIDKDGDTNTGNAVIDITAALSFEDDGPSVLVSQTAAADALAVDETTLGTNASANYADNFGNTPTFGADGAATVNPITSAFALGISTPGADSGLDDVATGANVLLYLEGGDVVGRAGSAAGAIVFVVSVSAAGLVSLDQQRALTHPNVDDPDDAVSPVGTNLITLRRTDTVTDRDGDTNTGFASIDITAALSFKDDGPSLAFGNLVGTGTDIPQTGFWSGAYGADGAGATQLNIAKAAWQLGGVTQSLANFVFNEVVPGSPDANGNFQFTGSLTGDFDNNGVVDANPLTFTLSANPTTGKYTLDLAAPVTSTTTTDTAAGALGAGGPDAVQTLRIPPLPAATRETVVFFSAKLGTAADNYLGSAIASGIITGVNDPTEATLEGNNPPATFASFIDPRSMNVSTSGIGVDNNNMNGYGASGALAIIDDFNGPGAVPPADDSFVVNPGTLVDKVRVFIDNSVTGYDYDGGERLQYRIFYDDGDVSDYQTVVGNLGKGALPKFFEIDGGDKKIDAVQLTMLYGEIKIPNIQFDTEIEALANDISLDFTATLTDKDGDTATSSFSADLFTNEAASATFDYELVGTANAADAFNVDLAPTSNKDYSISGFDTTLGARDKIVLIGVLEAAAQVSFLNGPDANDNSVVTILENGQTTTVTVIGIDLQAGDIVFG
jgi:hypothetical protein